MGHIYEQALAVLIEASPDLFLTASHIQIYDADNRTLGEVDFLIHDQARDTHIHLELAVKFYLAHERDGKWRFPGPNASDSFGRKINHMRDHQLSLCQRPEAKKLLQERYDIDVIEARHLITGCLFDPIGRGDVPVPSHLSPSAMRGKWLYREQFKTYFGQVEAVHILPKPFWLVPFLSETAPLFDPTPVQLLLEERQCVMFAIEGYAEKFFLVPDAWPDAFGLS